MSVHECESANDTTSQDRSANTKAKKDPLGPAMFYKDIYVT